MPNVSCLATVCCNIECAGVCCRIMLAVAGVVCLSDSWLNKVFFACSAIYTRISLSELS